MHVKSSNKLHYQYIKRQQVLHTTAYARMWCNTQLQLVNRFMIDRNRLTKWSFNQLNTKIVQINSFILLLLLLLLFEKLSFVYSKFMFLSKILQYFKGVSIIHPKLIKVICQPLNY